MSMKILTALSAYICGHHGTTIGDQTYDLLRAIQDYGFKKFMSNFIKSTF